MVLDRKWPTQLIMFLHYLVWGVDNFDSYPYSDDCQYVCTALFIEVYWLCLHADETQKGMHPTISGLIGKMFFNTGIWVVFHNFQAHPHHSQNRLRGEICRKPLFVWDQQTQKFPVDVFFMFFSLKLLRHLYCSTKTLKGKKNKKHWFKPVQRAFPSAVRLSSFEHWRLPPSPRASPWQERRGLKYGISRHRQRNIWDINGYHWFMMGYRWKFGSVIPFNSIQFPF